ncbi:hypothetical protein GR160_02970 [Flavobacterium sp. Sd200]|uniref:hypothetical protein n=1 Tax=Flavobacterium sp. Sd200 TaxID=2692211 RepID=UPI00137185D0|nr:hypothetical protein [Flavobacterium sp. Sd200]MXN90176.1 hypothetical protein [Flavobacterium sp. Sd200]
MKAIKFTKVDRDEVIVLQRELECYSNIQVYGLYFRSIDDFINAIIAVDTAQRLWVALRKKVESDSKFYNLKFNATEAAVIFKCCLWKRDGRTPYQTFVAEKYKNGIDNEFKNLTPGQ